MIGAFTAAAASGINQYFQGAEWAQSAKGTEGFLKSGLNLKGVAASVGAHGIRGGVTSKLQGGKFAHGFVSAGLGRTISPAALGVPDNDFAQVLTSATTGGTVSEISVGKFANGAATAAMSYAFSSVAGVALRGYSSSSVFSSTELPPAERQAVFDESKALLIDQELLGDLELSFVNEFAVGFRNPNGTIEVKGTFPTFDAATDFMFNYDGDRSLGHIMGGARPNSNQATIYAAATMEADIFLPYPKARGMRLSAVQHTKFTIMHEKAHAVQGIRFERSADHWAMRSLRWID